MGNCFTKSPSNVPPSWKPLAVSPSSRNYRGFPCMNGYYSSDTALSLSGLSLEYVKPSLNIKTDQAKLKEIVPTVTINEWNPKAFSGVYGGVSLLNHLVQVEPVEVQKKSTELCKECSQVETGHGCGTHRGYATLKEEYDKVMQEVNSSDMFEETFEKKKPRKHVRFHEEVDVFEVPNDIPGYLGDFIVYINCQTPGLREVTIVKTRFSGDDWDDPDGDYQELPRSIIKETSILPLLGSILQ